MCVPNPPSQVNPIRRPPAHVPRGMRERAGVLKVDRGEIWVRWERVGSSEEVGGTGIWKNA